LRVNGTTGKGVRLRKPSHPGGKKKKKGDLINLLGKTISVNGRKKRKTGKRKKKKEVTDPSRWGTASQRGKRKWGLL